MIFQKWKKYSDVANYLSHKNERNVFKYFVFWATQTPQTSRFEYVYFQVHEFYKKNYFCVAQNRKNFVIKICTLVGYIIWLCPDLDS
jgi:hypothetical protein